MAILNINTVVHRYRVFDENGALQGMFTNIPCAQDTITLKPARIGGGHGWYVVDFVTGKSIERGQHG